VAGTYVRKFFGYDEIKKVLKRLDRLTEDEIRTVIVQTWKEVHSMILRWLVVGVLLSVYFCRWQTFVVSYPYPVLLET